MVFKKIFLAVLLFSIFLNPAFAVHEESNYCSGKKILAAALIAAGCGSLGYAAFELDKASKNTILACGITVNSNDQNLLHDDPICLNGSKLGPVYTSDVVDQSGRPVNYHTYNETDYHPCVGPLKDCCPNSTVMCRMSTFPRGVKVMEPYETAQTNGHTAGMLVLACGSTFVILCTCFICATTCCCDHKR